MKEYNIVWETQSLDSSESMPLGGCDVGCNVWVRDDQLCIYLSQSGAFDENGTMLKQGRLRFWPERKECLSEKFCQELELENGWIKISGGKDGEKIHFLLWVDVTNANLHVVFNSDMEQRLNFSYDSWRYREREVRPEERGQCRNLATQKEAALEEIVYTWPDTVETNESKLFFFHQNRNDRLVYDRNIRQQGLEDVKQDFPNWLENRVSGGYLTGKNIHFIKSVPGSFENVDQMEYHYITDPVHYTEITVSLETEQYEDLETWRNTVERKSGEGNTLEKNKEWWQNYFARSFIVIDEKNPGSPYWETGRNYQLFRYMLGCNYYGKWPTKFNGGLFTFQEGFTPDYRNWSGSDFTAQNQRLVYWPMLKSGDFEAMKPQMDFYNHILEAGKARAKHYWGEEGAYFPEQITCFGTSVCAEYKWNRRAGVPAGEDDNSWVRMHYSTALEFALMMLEYADYSGEDITRYLDFIESVIRFYFAHYERDENGKLYIYPSTALETYKGDPYAEDGKEYGAANPMDVVAGLRNLLKTLIDYAEKEGLAISQYREWLEACPDLPKGIENGKRIYLPASKYNPDPFNCEIPHLYRIFPYSYQGLADDEKEIGRNTYNSPSIKDDQRLLISWHQNGIFAARLNMAEEAMRVNLFKLGNSGRRFPAFWGPGHDWSPDHNWGGSGMIGLQEMLIQVKGDGYELFPAWNMLIDVHFKLFIPGGKAVECRYEDGKMEVVEIACERGSKWTF